MGGGEIDLWWGGVGGEIRIWCGGESTGGGTRWLDNLMLHSEDSTGLPDHRTAVFTNFNLSNLVPQFNTNMMEKCNNRATYNNKLHIFKKVILNKK